MLAAWGLPVVFMETLDAVDYLFPRGQCADYLYWALTLLAQAYTRRSCDEEYAVRLRLYR